MSGLISLQSAFLPQSSGFGAFVSLNALTIPDPPRWIGVHRRFERFHRNLALTPTQQLDGCKRST